MKSQSKSMKRMNRSRRIRTTGKIVNASLYLMVRGIAAKLLKHMMPM